MVAELCARGYDNPDAANRFVRTTELGQRLVIDLLAPSYTGKMQTNRRHGDMTVDEIPGLTLALTRPGETLEVEVTMLNGDALSFTTVIPDPLSALCVNTLALHALSNTDQSQQPVLQEGTAATDATPGLHLPQERSTARPAPG